MKTAQAIQQATGALARGDLSQVHALCGPLLDDARNGAQARTLLARAHFLDAAQWFQKRQPRLADLRCRMALELAPELAEAHHLLGGVAWMAGLPRPGLERFRAAVRCNPDWPVARADRERAEREFPALPEALRAAPAPLPGGAPRYLLIKAWGAGFFSEVHHVIGHCLLAELTGRIPVVHWGDNCLFSDGGGVDAFRHFFKPLSDMAAADLPREEGGIFPPKWTADNLLTDNNNVWNGPFSRLGPIDLLGRAEPLVVSDFYCWVSELKHWIPDGHPLHGRPVRDINRALIRKYIAFAPPRVAQAAAFRREHLPGPYVAVHVRGSDKAVERADLKAVNRKTMGLVERALKRCPDHRLFVLTDSEVELERFTKAFGERVVSTRCQRTRGTVGVHFQEGPGRVRLGEEVVRDVLLALEADYFVGNVYSNISRFVSEFKDWRGAAAFIGDYDYEKLGRPLLALTAKA
ncbi:MAG: hypothetical protein HZA24_08365 [Nitrospirae bacterium]|nr:hypothetical protein [Nitrospirota bacterium]